MYAKRAIPERTAPSTDPTITDVLTTAAWRVSIHTCSLLSLLHLLAPLTVQQYGTILRELGFGKLTRCLGAEAKRLNAHRVPVFVFGADGHKRLRKWINLGGQTMPEEDVDQLREDIRTGVLNSWKEIHERYNELWKRYRMEKLRHAYFSLMFLYKDETDVLTAEMWNECLDKAIRIQQFICDQVYESRKKDYENPIRSTTFRNEAEKIAVIGKIEDVSFVKQIKKETEEFIASIKRIRNN